ncbi:uncharacterized protein LY89DRAFT_673711 [Mollisia scopiformis]|uniref:Uncharacterized protein n=1 Tax=Mollisia scopiformis TaxID=149040 RepID=A0A194WVA5_MOLSC|nr:uncharacterized protein LY89DRAFT_673711 [Mollisia scopiformis]KUJ11900.1 hypothetical protein LY89DRAFT_673711 [Mollisia scopiformis]
MRFIILLASLLNLALASTSQKPLLGSQNEYGHSIASATENANLIFNAVHSSMRQWGSSIQHNGMSFFPAYIPEGTLLYHGNRIPEIPIGPEWIAFEIPHAEMFAVGWRVKRPQPPGDGDDDKVEVSDEGYVDLRKISPNQLWTLDEPEYEYIPGYLHIYKANRPLKVLYLDGMAAGNSDRGTMDSQDILLLNFTGGVWDERGRAAELCNLAKDIGVEGFVRMECGFELIKCDFSEGLTFISHKQRPNIQKSEGFNTMFLFEFVREIGSRYFGIGAGRVLLDYSSMVSAFFYPANLSNPHPDPGQSKLPRLVKSDDNVLKQMRSDVRDAVIDSNSNVGIDWQGVADMIVKRFASRLQFLATDMDQEKLLSEVNMLVNTFIDYGTHDEQDPVEVCALHYLQPVSPHTEQDHLIQAAFKTVTHKICDTLNEVRKIVLQKREDENAVDVDDASLEVQLIRELNSWLDWPDWTTCGVCAVDEVCFIAVFPYGTEEDHYLPQCRNSEQLFKRLRSRDNYWMPRQR